MAIFSRRRGSTGQVQRPNAPVSSAAAVAANAAFLNKSPSAASLSSAAAAAALRSHTTSPEPIANLQTKRMVRRLSQSSNGSGSVIVGPGFGGGQRPVVRRSSQGSMTDRTFRSPSPGGVSPRRAPVPAADDAPPVPVLRLDGNSGEQHSRPSSRASATAPRPKPAPVKVYQPTGLPKVHELEREGSRNSINFSRPITSPTESTPPVSPTRPKTAGSWFGAPAETKVAARQSVHDRPKSAVGISAGNKSGIEAGLQSVARTPSKKKQKAATQAQGSKLAAGTLSKTPQGTAVSALSTQARAQTSSPTPLPKKRPATKAATAERTESDTDVSDADRRRQTNSPSRTRKSTHTLNKQPSVVMEEPDTEQDITKQKREQDSAYPKLDPAKQRSPQTQHLAPRSREPSLTPSTSSAGSPHMRSRPVSLEVPDHSHKSAHFSSNIIDTPSGVRHNPPPRSISPAKSALKHSPSSSIRTTSPVATFSPPTRPPGSDTSDSMSLTSQDGIKTTKRKKAARVSFDDSAIEQIHEREPKPLTNGVKNARRSLSPGLSDEDMDDETMKPRPALPSFGSVRKTTPRRNQPESPEKVTETLNDTTKQRDAQQGTSSDHAIASILNDAHGKKTSHDENAPLPPEVTSVEGTGHFSDSGESSDEEELIKVHKRDPQGVPTAVQEPAQKRDDLVARDSVAQHMAVPDIHVLPATPGIEDVPNELMQESGPKAEDSSVKPDDIASKPTRVSVPGGWDEDEEEPVAAGISQLVVTPSTSSKEPQEAGEEQAESDSDDSAAFSDAAEDPSELEPFGYASLDAIVESPLPSRDKQKEQAASPAMSSPLFDSSPEVGTPTSDNNDWSRASAYWSNQKQQLQRRESDQPATEDETSAQSLPAPKPKAVKPRNKPVVENPSGATSSRQPARQMRSSMREKQPRVVEERPSTFRKTMRGPPPGPPRPTPAERTKPVPTSALQQKTMRPASAGGLPSKPAPVTAKPSANDSDSESSFRKKPRRGSASDTGRYTMKRSMRSASLDRDQERRPSSSQGVPGPGRWSLRSMSPPGDTPQSNRSAFRTSLRGTSIPEGPTLRGSNSIAQGKQSKSGKFSMSGFSRGAKPPAATPAPAQTEKAFKSRFADSESEDEAPVSAPTRGPKQGFRSRYADSDDEDDQPRHIAADLTPVRGIPRPTNTIHEDSTDLDDSSDDEFSRRRRAKRDSARTVAKPAVPSQADIDKAMAAARQNVAAMTGNQALLEPSTPKGKVQKRVTLQTDAQSPPDAPATPAITTDAAPIARRKGLLGSIFSRRNSSSSVTSVSKPAATTTDMTPPASPGSPRGKLQRRHAPKLSRNASAQSQLSTKSDMSTGTTATATTTPAAPATPAMPAVKEDDETELWPLEPPRMPAAEEERERPASSDGVAESGRAKLSEARPKLERRSVSGGEKIKPQVYSEKTGKKKRFGRLRRAFRLDD
ncbi:hypothetical protein BDZ85DRAFT_264352 [Elsinoe ampelina]|uniref:Uncharacterized protein n=1 Tax=Elsinoe ampelina TaxID=302913 RepID=A0A6A6G8R0_9PEZI|nr:hypothetical protein BDZ85DRAFT_264352 [Elsinoe ampelina]